MLWSCVKNRRSVLSRVYLRVKACDIFSLLSSRMCSFLPILSLSREISCKQLISSLQMNKNGGHDLVQCFPICHFFAVQDCWWVAVFCLLISYLFVLLVCLFFFCFPLGTKPALIAAVVVLAILVVVLLVFVWRLKRQLNISVSSEHETSKLINSSRLV